PGSRSRWCGWRPRCGGDWRPNCPDPGCLRNGLTVPQRCCCRYLVAKDGLTLWSSHLPQLTDAPASRNGQRLSKISPAELIRRRRAKGENLVHQKNGVSLAKPSPRHVRESGGKLFFYRDKFDLDEWCRRGQADLNGGARRLVGLGGGAKTLGPFRIHGGEVDLSAI